MTQARRFAVDSLLAVALAALAYTVRHTGLPDNGLWHDDAWVATGAIHGLPSELFMVGSGHPGYTAGLMLVSASTGASSSAMAYPAFVAGVLGASLLFLALRAFGYARSTAVLVASALVVADVHILYSTRVKPYVIDALVVLGLTVLLPRIVRMTWTWRTAAAWVTFAFVVSLFSGFTLVATALAGIVLVLHAHADRLLRVAAVALQGFAQLLLYIEVQRTSNLAAIEADTGRVYDGHIDFSWNPLALGRDVLEHFRRVVNVYPGGPRWLLTIVVLVVVVGLAVGAVSDSASDAVRARYLGLLLLFTIVASTLGRFPFGAAYPGFHSRGERTTLWLTPVIALGLAVTLQRARDTISNTTWMRLGFDAVASLVALAVILSAIDERARPYAFSGTREATRWIEAELDDNDVVVLPGGSTMAYAVETSSDVMLEPTPTRQVGFVPIFDDERIQTFGIHSLRPATPAALREIVSGADRVYMYFALPRFGPEPAITGSVLADAGFVLEDVRDFEGRKLLVWRNARA